MNKNYIDIFLKNLNKTCKIKFKIKTENIKIKTNSKY